MKIKIEIKNRWTGAILFEYEKENNSVKDTLIEAVKNKAYLRDADLRDAYLRGAYLGGADLGGADLRGADLGGADLGDADLRGAYLRGADLRDADLRGADLRGAKNIPFIPLSCPSDGAFIGWKKVTNNGEYYLVKLEIPEDAKRSSATGTKCRCDKAKVLEISLIGTGATATEIVNESYTPSVTYKVGDMVYPDSFDDDRFKECSHGIHFFINKQEAIDYV